MKRIFNIIDNNDFKTKDNIFIIFLIIILGCIFGFIYESVFYKIGLGYFIKRGSTFGPWIPIYIVGSFLIIIITYRFKNKPLSVFLLNLLITGLLEYISGFILLTFFNTRLWDYNNEIWNFGNINGYICLRSVLFFGLSSLFLIYILIPNIVKLYMKYKKEFRIITILLSIICASDIIIYNFFK